MFTGVDFHSENTITNAGSKEYKNVTLYSKHKYVILCFQKKYFGGTLTTSKECMYISNLVN